MDRAHSPVAAVPDTHAARVPRRALLAPLLAALLILGCADAEPEPLPTAATPVTIATDDGIQLDARLFESRSRHLIVFLHAYDGDQSDWYALAGALAASGRAAGLTVDFRGYGLSGGDRVTDDGLVIDVEAAIAYGRSLGYRSIVLIGASMGGTAAIIAAARDPQIEGVIALSPPAYFATLDAVAAIRERKPLFAIIVAREDVSAMDAMKTLANTVQLIPRYRVIVSGEAHGTALLRSTAATDVRRRIDALLTELWDAP